MSGVSDGTRTRKKLEPQSSTFTISPQTPCLAEEKGIEPPNQISPTNCFQDSPLVHSDPFRIIVERKGIEPLWLALQASALTN